MAKKKTNVKENLSAFFKDSWKSLAIIGVLISVTGIYILGFKHHTTANKSSVMHAPTISGAFGDGGISPSYQNSLKEADKNRLEEANKTDGSFMPTVMPQAVKSQTLTPNVDDTVETGSGAGAPPELPDAQPHIDAPAAAPPAPLPPPPPPVRRVDNHRYVDLEKIKRMTAMLKDYSGPGVGNVGTIYTLPEQVASAASGGSDTVEGDGPAGGRNGPGQGGHMTAGSAQSLKAAAMGDGGSASGSTPSFEVPVAGTILRSHFISLTDSRVPGTVLAVVDQGPYRNSRLIGSYTVSTSAKKLMFSFSSMIVTYRDDSGQKKASVVKINAVAVNPETLSQGLATYVNTHLFPKIVSTLATSFMSGLGQAIQQSGSTATYTASGGSIISQGEKNLQQEMLQAGGQSASQVGSLLSQMFGQQKDTIQESQNTPFGLLFIGDTPSSGQQ